MRTRTVLFYFAAFALLIASCTEEDRKSGAKGISVDSVGMVHNYIVEEYVKRFGLDSSADVTECQLDSIFHRCVRIAIAGSFFGKDPIGKNYADNLLRLMDLFTRSSETGNCSTTRDWAGACEFWIDDKGLKAAIHDIHHSVLTGPALISYATQRLTTLTGLSAVDKVRAEGYSDILRHSFQYWQEHLSSGKQLQSTEIAKASADAFISEWLCPQWTVYYTLESRNHYMLKARIRCVPLASAVSIVAAYRR